MQKEYAMIRTDFADEMVEEQMDARGYTHVKKQGKYVSINHIHVHDRENPIEKEPGDYISISFSKLQDLEQRKELIESIDHCLTKMTENMKKIQKILVVGLGNRDFVSDALGPRVAKEILVTAHLFAHADTHHLQGMRNVAVLAPGVMGQTGLESSVIIEHVAAAYQPDLIFAIDALATRQLQRINRVIQISNTGIQPGSGVGNHRRALNEKTVHVPVIALGVATVTSIYAILQEAVGEKEEWIRSFYERQADFVVTPKAMDEELLHLSSIIAAGINRACHPNCERF